MWIAVSLLVIVVGAILRFAVSVASSGFNLHEMGVILLIVGIAGFCLALLAELVQRHQTVSREVVGADGGRLVERQKRSI